MFKKLIDRGTIQNASISSDEVVALLTESYPKYKIKKEVSDQDFSIHMKKFPVQLLIFRAGGRIIVKTDIPFIWELMTFFVIELVDEVVGKRKKMLVFNLLKERYSSE